LPLQAADMLAWKTRRQHVEAKNGTAVAETLFPFVHKPYERRWGPKELGEQMAAFQAFTKITRRRFNYEAR
jgi:hypothetical protein